MTRFPPGAGRSGKDQEIGPLLRRPVKESAPAGVPPGRQDQFDSFRASLLYCPTCRRATPTRERLLLVLETGNLFEYRCAECGTSTGSKTEKTQDGDVKLFLP